MSKHEKVPATQKQIGEIAGVLIGELDFSKDDAQNIIGGLGEFRRRVRLFYDSLKLVTRDWPEHVDEIRRWGETFVKLYGDEPDFSDIIIPSKPEGLGPMRLIMVTKEIIAWTNDKPLQGTIDARKKCFPCWQCVVNLDEEIVRNDRDPRNGSYALWVRDVREANTENANKSAGNLEVDNHRGLTVLEYLLFESDYFFERGEHLDQKNVTLLTGSRHHEDRAPYGSYYDGGSTVGWRAVVTSDPSLGSRKVYL